MSLPFLLQMPSTISGSLLSPSQTEKIAMKELRDIRLKGTLLKKSIEFQ